MTASRTAHHAAWQDLLARCPVVATWWTWATAQAPQLQPPDAAEEDVEEEGATLMWRRSDDPLIVDVYDDTFVWVCGEMSGDGYDHDPRLAMVLEGLA